MGHVTLAGGEFSAETVKAFERGDINIDAQREIKQKVHQYGAAVTERAKRGSRYLRDLRKPGGPPSTGNPELDFWIQLLGIVKSWLELQGETPNEIGSIDMIIRMSDETPVNTHTYWQSYLPESEYWGNTSDSNAWGYHRVSRTIDPVYHAAVDVLMASFNGYLWNFTHNATSRHMRNMHFCNVFPIFTALPGLAPDDEYQDTVMIAKYGWTAEGGSDVRSDAGNKYDRKKRTKMHLSDGSNGLA
jgi:hypothetical protein